MWKHIKAQNGVGPSRMVDVEHRQWRGVLRFAISAPPSGGALHQSMKAHMRRPACKSMVIMLMWGMKL